MSLQTRLTDFVAAVGADIKALRKKDFPTYVTSAVSGSFNAVHTTYNKKNSNTRQLRNDLIKAAYGNGKCEIVVVADSFGAGCISSSPSVLFDRPNSFPYAMNREFARRGIPEGGTGLVRVNDAGLTQDTRHVFTGTGWNHGGKFYSFTGTLNDSEAFTSDKSGTKAILTYVDHNDSATFTMAVDGATTGAGFSGTITNNGGAVAIKQLVLTTTIKVGSVITTKKTSATGANYLDIIGVQVVDDTRGGSIVHQLSQSGSTATGTGAASWSDSSAVTSLGYLLNNLNKITAGGISNPHLIVELGGNDHPVSSGADATHALISTITAAMTTIRGKTTGDCIFVISGQLVDSVVPQANWEAFINAMYVHADTLDAVLVDAYAKFGDFDQCVADGWITDGAGHWIAAAYKFLGHMIASVIAPEFGNVQTPQVITVPTGTTIPTTVPDGTLVAKYTP